MLVNTAIMGDIAPISLINFAKLVIMSSVFFHWIPRYIFPQYLIKDKLDSVLFNILFMLVFILTVIPFLLFLHIFSLPLFLLLLLMTKGGFLYYFQKRNYLDELIHSFRMLLVYVLDFIDKLSLHEKRKELKQPKDYISAIQRAFLPQAIFNFFAFIIFGYIIYTINLRGFVSYADAVPDVAQFMEWVHQMHANKLFWDEKLTGSDFYGQATFIFFLQTISGIDTIVLFNIYPTLLVFFILFGIFYVMYKITGSKHSALFSVVVFGLIFITPFSDQILGKMLEVVDTQIKHWHGLSYYFFWEDVVPQVTSRPLISIAHVPYDRYSAGLAYEFASSMFLLNNYFLAKTFMTRSKGDILLYGITLFLVFTFHGGGAIYLVASNSFIFLVAVFFGKFHWATIKKGLLVVGIVAIIGNMWIFSMLKYGIPQDFGAAAPFLDKWFHTKQSIREVVSRGSSIDIIVMNPVNVFFILSMLILPIVSFFHKKRFLYVSFSFVVISVMLIFFMSNLGLPRLARQTRAAEYLLIVYSIGLGLYFQMFIVQPLHAFYSKKREYIAIGASVFATLIIAIQTPRWIDTQHFLKLSNSIGYNDIAFAIYKISQKNQPYSWSAVAYLQSYPKLLDRAYHINTTDFIRKYDPLSSVLPIMSKKVYIFVENSANSYKGTGEWFYRWRSQVENQLKQWINLYSSTHKNIRVFYQTPIVTVYEIDNEKYVKEENERLRKLKRKKEGY